LGEKKKEMESIITSKKQGKSLAHRHPFISSRKVVSKQVSIALLKFFQHIYLKTLMIIIIIVKVVLTIRVYFPLKVISLFW